MLIRTDSKSELSAITNQDSNWIAQEIRELINNSPKLYLFSWVKAHNGELYNEIVDGLAKKATTKTEVDF